MWIDEFVELTFGKNHDKESVRKGVDLKYQNMPMLLYKYRNANDDHIEALKNDYLFSLQVKYFNDPFECAIKLSSEDISKNLYNKCYIELRAENMFLPDRPAYSSRDLLENITIGCGGSLKDIESDAIMSALFSGLIGISEQKDAETSKELIIIAQEMYNICSLSETYKSLLMWSHYADSHKGFCIGYDIKELNNDITELTLPVIYQNDFHTVLDIDDLNGSAVMYAYTVKSTEWKYEEEWRMFSAAADPPRKEKMPTPKVIYLGAKISDDKKTKIVEICKKKGIKTYQMILDSGSFQLVPKEIIY